MPRTLTLAEAADMLKVHVDTVSDLIRHENLPAARFGRAYVLIDEDVIAWVRTRYYRKPQEGEACGSTGAASAASGGSISPSRASRALTEALAPRTKPRRASGPPRLTAINGGSAGSEKKVRLGETLP